MRVAFYAPMKPPHHPAPSGDRAMARLLIAALEAGGHAVETASAFRSYDGAGDALRQDRLRALGGRLAERLVRRYRSRPGERRPRAWFTYHLYHKAPDWLGPAVAEALDIPYLVAEASFAPKQAAGPWAVGHAGVAAALGRAGRVFGLNASDAEGVLPLLADPARLVPLKPFLDAAPYLEAAAARAGHRRRLAAARGIDGSVPWLLAVAMMRAGDKLASYRILGQALGGLLGRPWRLLVAGFGPARAEVEAALAPLAGRVAWFGELAAGESAALYAACDLYVWPAVNEAYGMAFLEAQAAGLPVVAGRTGGVPGVVGHDESGILVPPGDAGALAAAVEHLLDDSALRVAMGQHARERVVAGHGIEAAAGVLDAALAGVTPGVAPGVEP